MRVKANLRNAANGMLATGVALVAGIVCAIAPWWVPVGLVIAVSFLVVTARSPFVGLVITFTLAFEAIPSRIAPDIPLGFFKLKPYELIFLWTIFVYVMRTQLGRKTEKLELPAFSLPLGFMLIWAIVGVVYGKYFQANGELVLAEARGFLGLFAAPVIALIVRDRKGIDRLSMWMCFVAVVQSVYVIAQAATGITILGGRVEALDSHSNADVTRSVVDAGVYLQGFALYHMTLSLRDGRQWRLWLLPLILAVLLGLLATFTRGAWAAAAFGGLIAAFLAGRWRGLFVAVALGSVLIGLTMAAAFVVKPRVAEAAIERVLGIGKELNEGGSYGWRKRENQQALSVISDHPLLGVGIGGVYKDTASSGGHFDAEYVFIHNTYLYFPLKMGLIAGLGPFLVLGAFALMLLRMYRLSEGQVATSMAVCAGTVAMIYVGAIEGPHLKSFPGLLILGAALSLAATSFKLMLVASSDEVQPIVKGRRTRNAMHGVQLPGHA